MKAENYISTYTNGRLGNQLYYILQVYIKSIKDKTPYKYAVVSHDAKHTFFNSNLILEKLNLKNYVFLPTTTQFKCNILLEKNNFYQLYNKDFSEKYLTNFCQILIKNIKPREQQNEIALHIRNTDYLRTTFGNLFNRQQYITNALKKIKKDINTIYVISDDNDLNYTMYNNIFKNIFQNIYYSPTSSAVDDLIFLSSFKNKILWNSTFSFWAGFISEQLFDNPFIIVPNDSFSKVRVPINWIHIL